MAGIELMSSAFHDSAPIPPRYTLDGENLSPPLTWSRPPAGTEELVLMCEDPDAPSGTFLHWLVTGIDPDSDGVATGRVPPGGTQHRNGMGDEGWDGPRPPVGDPAHRYFFRLFALPEPVRFPERASADEVHRALGRRQLASGTLMGLHQR
ncbi:YbhB/YbcL family Raf kinase inhibitor-like protein [Streptomyces radicis]|uniref:YbhB/YbcL family Raf kinase inhibitor-like protein n=1 Tax=Streptomyces radicis TaxID=1750517 RepID=A0A3A9WV05_9ACTN|nr:YbhB/YbcL family Raf kinase inhibitor-like protein [Streptomyces radicis]RKN11636.1 YbhB/YbcL family Raf kinase inhibitor-like protein [Streptomyces radicis]RKN26820.1 YbhB/YbcL family Raf kinase inhibitor-like protein [Streptomyces radicis]